MSKRHRMNGRMRRAIADIKQMKRGIGRLVKKTKEERGFNTEITCDEFLSHLLKKGLIKEIVRIERCSFMDCVNKVDKAVLTNDYKIVPIAVKTSFRYAKKFHEKHRDFFRKKYGRFPVTVIIPPGNHWQHLYKRILSQINGWGGHFSYRQWEIEYSRFFDYEKHQEFGKFEQREMLFLENLKKTREEKQVVNPP